MRSRSSVQEIGAAFEARFGGSIRDVRAHGTGHIHDTFVVRWQHAAGSRELLVQRFNTEVFRDPDAVMRNIARATEHVRGKLEAGGVRDIARRVLRIQPAPDGALCFRAGSLADGPIFRAFDYIGDTIAYDHALGVEHPLEAGRAFGTFAALLADLPAPPLVETIPGFHDTEARLASFRAAFDADPQGRSGGIVAERERVEARVELAGFCARLQAGGELPLQVTHNDAKLSNLLFDAESGEALCVVDLDTVMPGFPAYDFGDLVRTTCCLVAEDARDLRRLTVRMDYVEALARGFLEPARTQLREAEVEALVQGGALVCYELGIRFLTDHLSGDEYFPVARPGHNLDRARVQLALLDELTRREDELRALIRRAGGDRVGA